MPIIIIPARLSSERLPNKLLLEKTGKPLICHTIDRALESKLADAVYVVSEDQQILEAVKTYSDCVITMHTPPCSSGTERVRWAVKAGAAADMVVNLQGDEPELGGNYLDDLIKMLREDPVSDVATLAAPANNLEYRSYSVVKTVLTHDKHAMYFSRCSIPYAAQCNKFTGANHPALKHIGVYAYTREFLLALDNMEPTTLGCESLEQLQWLQSGFRIKVMETDIKAIGIDTLPEYESFVKRWQTARTIPIDQEK